MDAPYHLIGQFLREHPDFFCVDCLAAAIKAPPGQVSMATQRLLAGEAAFASRLDVCSRCARRPLGTDNATVICPYFFCPGHVSQPPAW
ncbi:MAG: hypothetical protein DMD80_20690 [Candidatus Rokuibacteriota bacterium]|nr:MAG: hypothetical protein DMD80_20690 [Candidatus Rokubacteria bacterium]